MTTSTPPPPNAPNDPPSSSTTPPFPTRPYHPRHPSFPYTPADFTRQDESPDPTFYSTPRFVTHIDDHAISLLGTYYEHALPPRGRILDFCCSWISHLPPALESAARASTQADTPPDRALEVTGLGINDEELAANPVLRHRILQDLNRNPTIPDAIPPLDAATCVVSVDYLTAPRQVLASLLARMKPGGAVHLVVSNRCFPTKVVGRWLSVGEEERLQMVGDYLWWAGWREVEIVTVCDGKGEGGGGGGWMGLFGGRRVDPLWVVRGRKVEGGEREGREVGV